MIQIEWGLDKPVIVRADGFASPNEHLEHLRWMVRALTVNGKPLAAHLSVAAAACNFRASEFSGYDDDDFDKINARILQTLIGEEEDSDD